MRVVAIGRRPSSNHPPATLRELLVFLASIIAADPNARLFPLLERLEREVEAEERQQDTLSRARKLAGLA